MKTITLGITEAGKEFRVPIDLVTQTVAIMGMRGSGKTNTAVEEAEGLLRNGQQVVIIDPLDVWWGLRSSADGKSEGFPVVVMGGEHGDLPLEGGAGKAIADFVIEQHASVILSTRHLSKAKQRTLVADFCEHLYERKGEGKHKTPLKVIIDEADAFAPQRIEPDVARCFGSIDDLVRRGRSSGFGVTLITQRPAVLHKDVLTQTEMLVLHRTVSPQDRKAIEAWVEVHDSEGVADKVLGSLHKLKKGEAWVWSPSWLEVLERVQMNLRTTFDSSYTPKVGETISSPKKIAAVDLENLKAVMGETLEKAKANDPAELKRQILDLSKKLTIATSAPPAAATIDHAAVGRAVEEAIRARDVHWRTAIIQALNGITPSLAALCAAEQALSAHTKKTDIIAGTYIPRNHPQNFPRQPLTPPPSIPPRGHGGGEVSGAKVSKAERQVLTVLAQYGPSPKNKIARIAGYAAAGGGFNNALSKCRSSGWITQEEPFSIQQAGMDALGTWSPLPTGPALVDYWMGQVPKAEKLILEKLRETAGGLTKHELAARTGYEASGGGFNNALSHLRTIELIEGKDIIRLSPELAGV